MHSRLLCGEASLLLLHSWAQTSQGLGSTGLIWDGVQGFRLLTSMLSARRCPFAQVPRGSNSQSILWLFCEYHGTVHPQGGWPAAPSEGWDSTSGSSKGTATWNLVLVLSKLGSVLQTELLPRCGEIAPVGQVVHENGKVLLQAVLEVRDAGTAGSSGSFGLCSRVAPLQSRGQRARQRGWVLAE